MGEQHFEPTTATEESAKSKTASRIRFGRLAQPMLIRIAVALTCVCCANFGLADTLQLDSRTVLVSDDPDFGGLSGLEIAQDGSAAYLLTDRGAVFDVVITRSTTGNVTTVTTKRKFTAPLADADKKNDTEGFVIDPNGGIWISYETPPHVTELAWGSSVPLRVIPFPGPSGQRTNRGLEALAIDTKGRLITIPEEPAPESSYFPIFRFDGSAWVNLARLPAEGAFSVTGADLGPDGQLYVLERAVSLIGFRSRIRVVDLENPKVLPKVLFQSRLGTFDNLEGISVWRDTHDTLRVTLVSDNNFLDILRSELVEFTLR